MTLEDVHNAFLERIISYNEKEKFLTALISFGSGAGYVNIIDYIENNNTLIFKTSLEKQYKFSEKDSQKIKSFIEK
jgi:hypothetical protein